MAKNVYICSPFRLGKAWRRADGLGKAASRTPQSLSRPGPKTYHNHRLFSTDTMKDISITVPVVCYGYDELPDDAVRALVEKARQSTYHSYAPYSHFCVGAAILLDNGETITGANQENAAFSAGTCAERSACFYAHANYPEARFEAIAIAARAEDGDFVADPVSPCGVCRQALLEYEVLAKHPVPVWLAGRNCVYRLPSVASLLPLAFSEF